MKKHCRHICPLKRRRLAWQRREADSGAVSAPEACHYHITIKSEHSPSVRNADKLWHSLVCAGKRSGRKEFGGSEKFCETPANAQCKKCPNVIWCRFRSYKVDLLSIYLFIFSTESAKMYFCRRKKKWQNYSGLKNN